ncbi:MAG: hypothetical protein ACXQTI_05615 [Candidatus Nezhaarchaeales archaeon]
MFQKPEDALDFCIARSHYLLASWVNVVLEAYGEEVKDKLKNFMYERARKLWNQIKDELEQEIVKRRDAITWWEVELKFLSPYVYSGILEVKPIELTPKRCHVRFTKCSFIKGWNLAMMQPDVMCEILKETERGFAEAINPKLKITEFNPGLARYEPYCKLILEMQD